jgi:hypothetical protein
MRKAKLLGHIHALQQSLELQAAAQHVVVMELRDRVETQEKEMKALQFQVLQRLAVLEQAHKAELSLLLEARQRQQQRLVQLQQAVEMQKQQLVLLDTALSKGQAA